MVCRGKGGGEEGKRYSGCANLTHNSAEILKQSVGAENWVTK